MILDGFLHMFTMFLHDSKGQASFWARARAAPHAVAARAARGGAVVWAQCRASGGLGGIETSAAQPWLFRLYVPWSRLSLGKIPPLMTGILIMGPYKPLRTWVDEFTVYPLLYGIIGSLDPSTYRE